jgi:hypothetical protein
MTVTSAHNSMENILVLPDLWLLFLWLPCALPISSHTPPKSGPTVSFVGKHNLIRESSERNVAPHIVPGHALANRVRR